MALNLNPHSEVGRSSSIQVSSPRTFDSCHEADSEQAGFVQDMDIRRNEKEEWPVLMNMVSGVVAAPEY